MTDAWLEYAGQITKLSPLEKQWWEEQLKDTDTGYDGTYTFELDSLILYSEQGTDPAALVELVQEFIKKYRPKAYWTLGWAYRSSRLDPNCFGGGAYYVTAEETKSFDTESFVREIAYEDAVAKGLSPL